MKVQIEWKDGDAWRTSNVELHYSRNNNIFFNHLGLVYVFPSIREGAEVVSKNSEGKWVKVGRVTRESIFLGEGLSWSETNELKFKAEMKWDKPIFEEVKA